MHQPPMFGDKIFYACFLFIPALVHITWFFDWADLPYEMTMYFLCAATSFVHWWKFSPNSWRRYIDIAAAQTMYLTIPFFVFGRCFITETLVIYSFAWILIPIIYYWNCARADCAEWLHICIHLLIHISVLLYQWCLLDRSFYSTT